MVRTGSHLREQLRQATGTIHARLDKTIGHLPLSSGRDYIAFLTAQFCARGSVERAIETYPPLGVGAPPLQVDLLSRDLRDLGVCAEPLKETFELESPAESLGAAWVLAGSSLGNRAMLVRRRKAGFSGPERFLADKRLAIYFNRLVGVLEADDGGEAVSAAIQGARKSFIIFERAFNTHALGVAA